MSDPPTKRKKPPSAPEENRCPPLAGTKPAAGDLRLHSIRPAGDGRLLVTFTVGSVSGDADCRPADIDGFGRFRRFLMGRGVFARHDGEGRGRRAAEAWADEVQAAWGREPPGQR